MIAKISSLAIAALIVGSASIASAATVKHAAKHHGTVYLLEDRGTAYPAPAGKNFQDKFNIDY